MSLSPDTIHAIKALISEDDALLEQLSQATDAAGAARLVAEAANRQGVHVEVAQIEAYFAEQASQALNEISDEALDAVAGGGPMSQGGAIALSIFSFGFGCLIYSTQYDGGSFGTCQVSGH